MSTSTEDATIPVAIVGAGIAGLVLALELHRVGIRARVFEAAPELRPLGVGINLLPHATGILAGLGLLSELDEAGVRTSEAAYYNRFGQHIHTEPVGLAAGYATPQFSIHRGDLHMLLLAAVRERLGEDAVVLGHRCVGLEQDETGVVLRFADDAGVVAPAPVGAEIVVACDGVHSVVRSQFYPQEGEPRYSGVMMWRGTTVVEPYLSGSTMVRAGWLDGGKMVVYPIRNNVDGEGRQLVNWVAEIQTEQRAPRDWTGEGNFDDFAYAFDDWSFEWLDVAKLIRNADIVLEYPMVDQDPLPRWTFGRVTLAGDAAHPMVPRGSNGAGQAIIDAHRLAQILSEQSDARRALLLYEAERLPATTGVVLTNRIAPPDTIVRLVWERTGDTPFDRVDDVISTDEIDEILHGYKRIAGYLPPVGAH